MQVKTIAISLAVVSVLLLYTGLLNRWDLVLYDLTAGVWSRTALDNIRIIAIDEPSLTALGRWPWSRRHHVALIETLSEIGVKAIGLDIIFAEPDRQHPDTDQALAAAIAANGSVVLPVLPKLDPATNKLVEEHPLAIIKQAAASLGHVDAELDADGIARSVFLKAGLSAPTWPSLPLAMLQLDKPGINDELPGRRRRTAEMNPTVGNWVRDHHLLIPFTGPPGHIRRLSYVDVLTDKIDPAELRGKWVLVGMTATGLGDTLPTPTSHHQQPMPGVEFNANILDSLIQGITLLPMETSWHTILTPAPHFRTNFDLSVSAGALVTGCLGLRYPGDHRFDAHDPEKLPSLVSTRHCAAANQPRLSPMGLGAPAKFHPTADRREREASGIS